MERRQAPTRFSDQIRLLKLKKGIALGRTGSDTGITKKTSTGQFGPSRTHHSAPVYHSGKFNYELQRTGFLGETKMRAKRIAQNPKRFLEAYADGRSPEAESKPEFIPTELPELEQFIQNLTLDDRFEAKKEVMTKRNESSKFRTFLLAMSSTSSIEMDPKTLSFLSSYTGNGEGEESSTGKERTAYEDAETMESLVINYLEQIRSVDKSLIQVWVGEFLDISDLELPHGLPPNIPMQLNAETTEFGDSSEIREFIESAQDNFLLLDGEFHTKVVEITKELQNNYNCLHEEWTNEDSSLLFYVMNAFGAVGSESASVLPLQLELMRRLFPGKTQTGISKQKFRLKTKKALEEKRAAVIRAWVHAKNELHLKLSVAWKEVSRKRESELERKQSIKKQRDVCEFWAERLEKLQKEKCLEIKKLRVYVEPLEKYQERKTKSIAETEAQRREAVKSDVLKYKLHKVEEEAQLEAQKEIERERKMAALQERIVANKHRVWHRKKQHHLKEKARKELEAAMEEQRRLRVLQLERTKEPVNIDYDPSSVVAETHASTVRRFQTVKEHKKIEDERMAAVFRDCYSFSAETVLKDRRLRFQAKLKEAGLQDSAYARQILMAMEPKAKPHLQSQLKFDNELS